MFEFFFFSIKLFSVYPFIKKKMDDEKSHTTERRPLIIQKKESENYTDDIRLTESSPLLMKEKEVNVDSDKLLEVK